MGQRPKSFNFRNKGQGFAPFFFISRLLHQLRAFFFISRRSSPSSSSTPSSSAAYRYFGYLRYPLPLRHANSGRHGPPCEIRFATALLWRWSGIPLPKSAMATPWPICDNTAYKHALDFPNSANIMQILVQRTAQRINPKSK